MTTIATALPASTAARDAALLRRTLAAQLDALAEMEASYQAADLPDPDPATYGACRAAYERALYNRFLSHYERAVLERDLARCARRVAGTAQALAAVIAH